MDTLRAQFSKAPEAIFEAVEQCNLEGLIAFWARVAPLVDTEADCSPELWDALLLTTFAINGIGEAMMSPEQAEASRQREIAVLQLN